MGLFLIWEWSLNRLIKWQLVVGLLLLAGVVAPWYVIIHEQSQGAFLSEFWGQHNLHRFTKPMHGKSGPIYYQLVGLCIFFAPWCLSILVVTHQMFRLAFAKKFSPSEAITECEQETAQHRDAYRLLMIWSVAFVVFYSLSATKFTHYVFPMYPTLAILTGRTLDRWRKGLFVVHPAILGLSLASLILVGVSTGLGFAVAGGGITIPGAKVRILDGLANYWAIGLVPVIGAAVCFMFYLQQKRTELLAALSVTCSLFVGLIAAFPVMAVDQLKAPRSLAQQAGIHANFATAKVSMYDYPQPSLVYYMGARIPKLSDPFSTAKFLSQSEPAYLVIPESTWEKISAEANVSVHPIARAYDFYQHEQILVLGNDAAQMRTAKLQSPQADEATLHR